MDDGIYLEIFAAKGGKRINFKIISLRQLSNTLTNGLMNSIEEIIEIEPPKEQWICADLDTIIDCYSDPAEEGET